MKNLNVLCLTPLLFFLQPLTAQNPLPERQADFTYSAEGAGIRFKPVMPPLMQRAGAPKAYYEYFWEFGDGSFSKESNPLHVYARPGDYTVSLDAIAHYDTGKKAKKQKKPVKTAGALAGTAPGYIFDEKLKQSVAMGANAQPKAEEEITCIISYRNNSFVSTDGKLHLFFNEKKYPSEHFQFADARTHFGEISDPLFSQTLPVYTPPMMDWTAIPAGSHGGVSIAWTADFPDFSIVEDMLNIARGTYREEKAWRFIELAPGEKRNFFVSLASTPNMVKDTHAFIHIEAIFAPTDPVVAPERFVMEIEIVSAHDPNAIAVSDNRVNYRTFGNKKLDYKVQFQNNGKGPASTIEVKIEIPKGLDMARMRPTDWHPKCPICPKPPGNQSCLDTASSKNGLVFTFRNIYLPGSSQKDVSNRDSTKGFVKYRIEADKDMPKLSFSSRAKIVFDKEPPVVTNFTKTRFKIGISPGLKIGYNFVPDSSKAGYFFLGASISPYKSWRIYPQIELLTGVKGQTELPEQLFTSTDTFDTPGAPTRVFRIDSLVKGRQGFVSFEVPFLLRKNFTKYFGVGVGGSVQIFFENGERTTQVREIRSTFFLNEPEISDTTRYDPVTRNYSGTRTRFSFFGDLTFGSVRAGPNLGIRAGALFDRRKKVQPFVQVSLEMKL